MSEHITMLCAASVAGLPLPPMIIYSKSFPGGQYCFDWPYDALYTKSESGWIGSESFLKWMRKVFLKHVVIQWPVLLFTDGHMSHISLDVIDLCQKNEIILFCLPPHTTHALQPLDVAVFKSLKDNSATFAKPSFMVTKREFSKVICEPFEVLFSIINIKAGFLKCGIHPFNPGAIEAAKMLQSASYGFGNDPSTSSSEQSSASSPAPVPVRGESSRIRNSMPLSVSLVVPIQTLTTHHLVRLHSVQVIVAQEAVLYQYLPHHPKTHRTAVVYHIPLTLSTR